MTVSRQPRSHSKTAAACKSLYEFALEREPHEKLPTTRELSELLDISRTTINEALNILEAQDVLYRKQSSGIYVSPKIHRKTIYILLYSHFFAARPTSPFWGMLWNYLAQEAAKRMEQRNEHYSFHMILPTHEHEVPEELQTALSLKKIHGVLTIGMLPPLHLWLAEHEIPSVTFAGWGHWEVITDWEDAVPMAVDLLVQQGCRSIGYWNTTDPYYDGELPDEIVQQRLSQHGLAFDPAQFKRTKLPVSSTPINNQEQGYQLAYQVFGSSAVQRPDGLIIDNDMLTAGMLIAFQELGLKVGQDVKVVSHANAESSVLFGYRDKLTHIEYNPAELIRTMFTVLDQQLAGEIPRQGKIRINPKIY